MNHIPHRQGVWQTATALPTKILAVAWVVVYLGLRGCKGLCNCLCWGKVAFSLATTASRHKCAELVPQQYLAVHQLLKSSSKTEDETLELNLATAARLSAVAERRANWHLLPTVDTQLHTQTCVLSYKPTAPTTSVHLHPATDADKNQPAKFS